jgi:hypothetical protein
MNVNTIARQYARLTPEERFRLILAASARGDEAERDLLVNAGERVTLAMPDHAPYAHAFQEIALLVFIELFEAAARYFEAFGRMGDARDLLGTDDGEEEGDEAWQAAAGPAGFSPRRRSARLGPVLCTERVFQQRSSNNDLADANTPGSGVPTGGGNSQVADGGGDLVMIEVAMGSSGENP